MDSKFPEHQNLVPRGIFGLNKVDTSPKDHNFGTRKSGTEKKNKLTFRFLTSYIVSGTTSLHQLTFTLSPSLRVS